jgi:hypothetical protein
MVYQTRRDLAKRNEELSAALKQSEWLSGQRASEIADLKEQLARYRRRYGSLEIWSETHE